MSIQLFVPKFRVEECLDGIRECLEKGWTGLGYKTVEFEEAWCRYTGLAHAHFLNSATAGLHLAINILKKDNGWIDGDEIISTPISFVSTNHAILYERLNVVFADVDEYLCLDPEDVERKITTRTKAIVFVGIGGNTGRWEKIVNIALKHNLKLILDAAHMAGTRLNDITPGKEADAVVYSFQAVKNLPTADSGMLCFRDEKHDKLSRKLSWLGIDKDTYTRTVGKDTYKWKYDVQDVGFKYHGNSIMAAIGLVQLKYLEKDNDYRRKVAHTYDKAFAGYEEHIQPIRVPEGCISSRHLYIVKVAKRDELILLMNKKGIFPGVHYSDNTSYPMYAYARSKCINATNYCNSIVSLPMHINLSSQDIGHVARTLISIATDSSKE